MVPPVVKAHNAVAPVKGGILEADASFISEDVAKERQWLVQMQALVNKPQLDKNDYLSWAAYHASRQPPLDKHVSINSFLCSVILLTPHA